MAGLSLRAKLALTHTSLSQRQMAAVMGVSPRTVGRWLREGTAKGVRKIPREAAGIIGVVWDLHKQLSRDAAERFQIPYSSDVPVYAVRKPINKIDPNTGLPMLGDRIFIEHAQFLDTQLRQIVILDFALSGKMVVASVGSNINLYRYYQETLAQRIEEQKKSRLRGRLSARELRQVMRDSFESTFGVDLKTLQIQDEIRMVYTKQRAISPEFDIVREVQAIENHIRQKHEAAATGPGTSVGNVIIVQMKRESTNEANSRIAAREAAKNRRGKRKS